MQANSSSFDSQYKSIKATSYLVNRSVSTSYMRKNILQRDYSIDSKTDRIFREFARIDPKFEDKNCVSSELCQQKQSVLLKNRSLDTSNAFQSVPVPVICYPENEFR